MKTAIIGLPPLAALGIRWVCSLLEWEECHTYRSGAEMAEGGITFDILVASADIVAAEPELFMPRRQKLITVTASPIPEGSDRRRRCITPTMGEKEIAGVLTRLEAELSAPDARESLSQREEEVLREVAAGKTNKEIADTLCISINTVITHRKNIAAKLGIRSASGLSLYAMMHGILDPSAAATHPSEGAAECHGHPFSI